jgi:hypothetical protein
MEFNLAFKGLIAILLRGVLSAVDSYWDVRDELVQYIL